MATASWPPTVNGSKHDGRGSGCFLPSRRATSWDTFRRPLTFAEAKNYLHSARRISFRFRIQSLSSPCIPRFFVFRAFRYSRAFLYSALFRIPQIGRGLRTSSQMPPCCLSMHPLRRLPSGLLDVADDSPVTSHGNVAHSDYRAPLPPAAQRAGLPLPICSFWLNLPQTWYLNRIFPADAQSSG